VREEVERERERERECFVGQWSKEVERTRVWEEREV